MEPAHTHRQVGDPPSSPKRCAGRSSVMHCGGAAGTLGGHHNGDASGGTWEQKRLRRAVPQASNAGFPRGCIGTIATYTAACLVLYWWAGWFGWMVLAAPGLIIMVVTAVRVLHGIGLLAVANHTLGRRGQRCVLVYSRSPVWES